MKGPSGVATEHLILWKNNLYGIQKDLEKTQKEIDKFYEKNPIICVSPLLIVRNKLKAKFYNNEWFNLTSFIQNIFISGIVPKEMTNITMIMIPKAQSEKLRGIGIIDIIWKLVEYMIKARLEKNNNE